MVSLREIRIVESQRDVPLGSGGHRAKRRRVLGFNSLVVAVLLGLCCLLVVYNMQLFSRKRSARDHDDAKQGRPARRSPHKADVGTEEEDTPEPDVGEAHTEAPRVVKKSNKGRVKRRRKQRVVALEKIDLDAGGDASAEGKATKRPVEGEKEEHAKEHGGGKHRTAKVQEGEKGGRVRHGGGQEDSASGSEESVDYEGPFSSLEERIERTVGHKCDLFAHLNSKDDDPKPRACRGPPIPANYADLKEVTGCALFTVPFNPEDDVRCLKLLSDSANWAELKPMTQKYDERTIKFKATFKIDKRLKAIIKVPQKLFQYEAMSEVGSFVADRVLRTNRVPPTTWAHVPVKRIESMLDSYASDMKLIDLFARESHVRTYREWVDKDFLKYNRDKGWMVKDDEEFPDEEVVGVSVQLFIADVRPLLSSDFLMPWVPHNDSWQAHLSPKHPYKTRYAIPFVRQSELAMYDYVVGNGDRSPNKNNFVVGGCRHHRHDSKCPTPRHPGAPSFVTLDNGMMFFYELTAGRSPDGPNPLLKKTFCRFEKKLLRRIQEFEDKGFSQEMEQQLPKPLKKFITRHLLHRCDKRIEKLLKQFDDCVAKFDESSVIVA